MKTRFILALLLIVSISCGRKSPSLDERFRKQLIDVMEAGDLKKLTDDGRSIYPIFGPGDSIVFYKRLLTTESADTFLYKSEDLVKAYGVNISTGELYTLSKNYEYPAFVSIDKSQFPSRVTEHVVWALHSPADSTVTAFETTTADNPEGIHELYLMAGDLITQLTYGNTSCFLDRISNTGRYISAVYGTGPTWIIIYDTKNGSWYRIPHESESIDYLTSFSSDDKMMVFVRSEKKYKLGPDYFGNVFLLKFN